MSLTRLAVFFSILCVSFLAVAKGQDNTDRYFNVKAGPVYMTLHADMSTEYTDNVNLSNGKLTPIQSDIILSPNLGINASTQVQFLPKSETSVSTLGFNMNLGYRDYLMHPELNNKVLDVNIAPDSELSLIVHAGHFKIRIHDGFSLQSDPVTDGALSNVAQFRRFTNTFGVATGWSINSTSVAELGYTHSNLFALDLISLGNTNNANKLSTSQLNNSVDALSFSASTRIYSLLTPGFGGSVQASTYPDAPEQDSTTYNYGPFVGLQLTQYTSIKASCGVSQNERGNVFTGSGSTNYLSSNSTSEYWDVSIENRLNSYYTHTLSTGRQVQLDLIGAQTALNYLRYISVWRVNSHINLNSGLFVEDSVALASYGPISDYRRYGCEFGTSYQLSRKLSTSLNYRFVDKVGSAADQSYKQSTITWNISYRF